MRSNVSDQESARALFGIMFIGFIIGVFIGGAACTHMEKWSWEGMAIRNGAARYNDKTAKFEWINKEVPNVE